MAELIIHIDSEKEPLVKELIKQLGGTVADKKRSSKKHSRLQKEIIEAVKEINEIKQKKRKARNAEDFLNELRG